MAVDRAMLKSGGSSSCPPPLDEKVLVALYNGIAEAIVVAELKSRCIVYWNDGAEALFGYSAVEVLQKNTERLFTEKASYDKIYEIAMPELEQKGFWRGEWQYRRRNGTVFPAEATSTLLTTEKGAYIVQVLREVTERKEADRIMLELNQQLAQRVIEQTSELVSKSEELQQQEAQRKQVEQILGNLLRNINNYAILITDDKGRVMDWNRTASRLLGYEGSEMLDQHVSIFLSDEDGWQEVMSKALDEAVDQGTYRDYQPLIRKDRSCFYARIVVFALRDDTDGLQGFLFLLRDDSQERNLRDKLKEKEHLAAIGTAASLLAHEIGNPLNGISTTVQLLERFLSREGVKTPQPMVATLKDLKSEIDRLTALLNDFKIIARPQKLNIAPLELPRVIQDVVGLIQLEGKQQELKISSEIPREIGPISGDAEKLKQALLNLVRNAVEAMPYGGMLKIKGYRDEKNICVDVIDTGIGIPENLKVFELFSSTKPHGTGLGLFIVRQIVLAHDGWITYSSKVGEGTTFHITLPGSLPPENQRE